MENNQTEQKPYLRWFQSEFEEDTDIDFEWECFLEDLNELLKEINPDGYFYCKVSNFGWRNQNGYAYLQIKSGKELIQKVLPNCDCSFNIFRENNKIKIQNYHHDSPMGNEWYELTSINQEQFENEDYKE